MNRSVITTGVRGLLVPAGLLALLILIWGKLLFTEIMVEIHPAFPSIPASTRHYERGWPMVFARNSMEGSGLVTIPKAAFSLWSLLADLAIALTTIGLFTAWLRRRWNRAHPWRYSLRTLLVAVLLVGGTCGWLMQAYRSAGREQAAIRTMNGALGKTCELTDAYRGPQWLRRFVRWPIPLELNGSVSPYLSYLNSSEPLPIFHRVTRLCILVRPIFPDTPVNFSSKQLRTITQSLEDMPYLTTIDMPEDVEFPDEPDQFAKWFYVKNVSIGNANRKMLECFARIPRLRNLRLDSNQITDECLVPLENCRCLQSLDLHNADRITDSAVALLCQMKSLEGLDVTSSQISDQGVRRLVALPQLKRLVVPYRTADQIRVQFTQKIAYSATVHDQDE